MNTVKVTNANGYEMDYDAAVSYMDDDIREDLHSHFQGETEQEFLTAYEAAHEAQFGEPWFLSAAHPIW